LHHLHIAQHGSQTISKVRD